MISLAKSPSELFAEEHRDSIYAPGAIIPPEQLPNEDYHSSPGVSCSGLKRSLHSIRRLLQRDDAMGAALFIGSAVNDAILHGDLFESRYVQFTKPDRRTKAGKAIWEDASESYAGCVFVTSDAATPDRLPGTPSDDTVLLSPDIYSLVRNCRDAAMLHPKIGPILESVARREWSHYWEDQQTGLLCRCRPDCEAHTPRGEVLANLDIKCMAAADWESFRSAVFRHSYHMQDAFYTSGVSHTTGDKVPFWFIVIGKDDPCPENVAVYELDRDFKNEGQALYRKALSHVADWAHSQGWRGLPIDLQTITMKRERENG